MSGIIEIERLLAEMRPELQEEVFVYCVAPFAEAERCYRLQPLATFREDEGLSLILPQRSRAATGRSARPSRTALPQARRCG